MQLLMEDQHPPLLKTNPNVKSVKNEVKNPKVKNVRDEKRLR